MELAQALSVNIRTIYRDIDALVSAGLPIRGLQGPSGGYELVEYFPVDPLVYSNNEALSLISTKKKTAPGWRLDQAIDTALHLLSSNLPEDARILVDRIRRRFLFDTSNWFWKDAAIHQYPSLKEAILRNQTVEIIYTRRGRTEIQTELLDPYGMVWRQGHWYLVAYSQLAKRFIRHRIQRIISARPTGRDFIRDDSFDLTSCWADLLEDFGSGETLVRMRIEFPATLDFEAFGWKKDQPITKAGDHWIVEMSVDNYDWLIPLALSYGDKVEILDPPSLRTEIAEKLIQMARRYSTRHETD